MKAWMENIVQRWDNLVQKVEKTSSQVNDTNYYTIHYAQ
jgi:hypothetical protein